MNRKHIWYWATTGLVTLILGASGTLALFHAAAMMRGLAHLGYPPYFANILGLGKLIGLYVFLAPGLARLKEWAYAGFTITVVSACYSHFCSGDGLLALEPLVTLAALMVSYSTRPDDRKFTDSGVSNAVNLAATTQGSA